MKRPTLSAFRSLGVVLSVIVTVSTSPTALSLQPPDSLYDVFPLNVGNEWVYDHFHHIADDPGLNPMYDEKDTGTVVIRVLSKSVTADSTVWQVSYAYTFYSSYNLGQFSGPFLRHDTSAIVEFHTGRHRLIRTGDAMAMRYSALPLLPNFVDSAQIFRYAAVDPSQDHIIASVDTPRTFSVNFTFMAGVGLTEVVSIRGCTCLPTITAISTLRASTVTAVNHTGDRAVPAKYTLEQNFPNPFNSATTFVFHMKTEGCVILSVFDPMGREVMTPVESLARVGANSLSLDFGSLPSGVYFYRLTSGATSEIKRMILLK